jgi:hypothetical protein
MKFRNPWIDPRVVEVRASAAQAYLRDKGWKPLPPEQPNLLPFDGPSGGDDNPVVQVPVLEQARDYPQRVIELITDVAVAEGRYAVEVLNDILRQPTTSPPNGPAAARPAESAAK